MIDLCYPYGMMDCWNGGISEPECWNNAVMEYWIYISLFVYQLFHYANIPDGMFAHFFPSILLDLTERHYARSPGMPQGQGRFQGTRPGPEDEGAYSKADVRGRHPGIGGGQDPVPGIDPRHAEERPG